MTIKYDPSKLLSKVAPKGRLKKALTSRLSVKKAALKFAQEFDFLDKKAVESVALKTIKQYKKRAKGDPEMRQDLKRDPAQLIQRVQNEVVQQASAEIRNQYTGEFYIWLPSDAAEPDPEHQLKYGKKFRIGDGEMPGDRYGCRCGMEILVEGSRLKLD